MSAGEPSSAEPYLLRLHALLGAHELPTDRADALLAFVSKHRANARVSFGLVTPVTHHDSPASVEIPANAESAASMEIMPVAAAEVSPVAVERSFADDLEELTLEDTMFEAKASSKGLLGIEFELVELTPSDNAALAVPAPVASVAAPSANGLGFEVRYGTQSDDEAALAETIAPPVSIRVPTPQPARAIPPTGANHLQSTTAGASTSKPGVQASSHAPRAVPAAEDAQRKIRLPKIRFR